MYSTPLALFLGNHPDLAHKEIEAAATILPFPWLPTMLRPGILQLKPIGVPASVEVSENALQQLQEPLFLNSIQRLQRRLGGTVKIAALLTTVDQRGIRAGLEQIGSTLASTGERLTFGVSSYGVSLSVNQLGLELKRAWKKSGSSARFVPTKEGMALSSTQIFHNHLDLAHGGAELIVVKAEGEIWLGVTLTVQNVAAYSERDFGLPAPDPLSGMLPPKLAQTMLNLAVGNEHVAVYDPFCGNGRVVQEAALLSLEAFGSDIEAIKVEASRTNLAWLAERNSLSLTTDRFWVQDATQPAARDRFALEMNRRSLSEYVIVAEPYLGPPLRSYLLPGEVTGWLAALTKVYEPFLETWSASFIGPLLPKRLLLIFPEAKVQGGAKASLYVHLIDTLNRFGYSHSTESHYARPDAIVGRDLVLLEYR